MKKFTTQYLVLKEIVEYEDQHGYAPSIREIGASLGLNSSASVHYHIEKLEAAGYIERLGSPTKRMLINEKARQALN